MKKTALPLLGVALFIVIAGIFVKKSTTGNLSPTATAIPKKLSTTASIVVSDIRIPVEVANTNEDRERGLSGRDSLDANEGMLFVFDTKGVDPVFWMKDMKFPLDLIWIRNGKISQIDRSIPAPQPDQQNSDLKLYSSKVPTDYVLEVNAGFAQKYNMKVGDPVVIPAI